MNWLEAVYSIIGFSFLFCWDITVKNYLNTLLPSETSIEKVIKKITYLYLQVKLKYWGLSYIVQTQSIIRLESTVWERQLKLISSCRIKCVSLNPCSTWTGDLTKDSTTPERESKELIENKKNRERGDENGKNPRIEWNIWRSIIPCWNKRGTKVQEHVLPSPQNAGESSW